MLFRILIWTFILVMVFRFIARFVLPILHITRTAQDKIRQMQQQMDQMNQPPANTTPTQSNKAKEGDYIEYEEVK